MNSLIFMQIYLIQGFITIQSNMRLSAVVCLILMFSLCLQSQVQLKEIVGGSDCSFDCCRTLSDRQPMIYTYYQKTGKFVGGKGEFRIQTYGYSGQREGYLNPDMQCVPNIGPLPASVYKLGFCKNMMHQTAQRPCSFFLDPQRPQEICGRSDFFIHGCQCCTAGDDSEPPAAGCSAGCVIISYANRRKLRVGDTLIVKHYQEAEINSVIE